MAYGNKYQRYLNDDRREPSSPASFINKTVDLAAKTVTAAALVGGGYLGFKYLKDDVRVGEKIRDTMNSSGFADTVKNISQKIDYVDAYFSGVNETIERSGFSRILSGKAHDELSSNLSERFAKVKIGDYREIGGADTKIERILYDLQNFKDNIRKEAVTNVHKDTVIEAIAGKYGDTEKGNFITNMLSSVINKEKNNKRFISGHLDVGNDNVSEAIADESAEFFKQVLKSHELHTKLDAADYVTASQTLQETLREHSIKSDEARRAFEKTHEDVIQQQIDNLTKQYNESIVESMKKEGLVGKGIRKAGDYRVLTVEEAIEGELLKTPIKSRKRHIIQSDKTSTEELMDPHALLKQLADEVPEIKDAFIDPSIFINKQGKVLDMRSPGRAVNKLAGVLGENFQVPFVNIKPFKIINNTLGIGQAETPLRYLFKSNSIMPTINNSLEELGKDYYYFNGRVVDEKGNFIKKNQKLILSTHGPWSRSIRAQSGAAINPKVYEEPTTVGEWIKKSLGIGYQDYPSSFERKLSLFTKFKDPKWERNIYDTIKTGKIGKGDLEGAYKRIFSTVDKHTKALDKDTIEMLSPFFRDVLGDEAVDTMLKGSQEDAVFALANALIGKDNDHLKTINNTLKMSDSSLIYRGQIESMANNFATNPESMRSQYKFFKHREDIVVPEILESIASNSSDRLTQLDQLEKILHAELLHQVDLVTPGKQVNTVGSMIQDMITSGATDDQIEVVKSLNVHKELRKYGGPLYNSRRGLDEKALDDFAYLIQSTDGKAGDVARDLENIIKKANPMLGYGPGQKFENAFKGNEYVTMGKSQPLTAINEVIKDGGNIYDVFKLAGNSFGFGKDRVGRYNLDKVSDASNMAYYYLFRLNEGISKLGIGLSYMDMGSTQDIATNLFLKRILAPLAVIGTASYINDEIGNITGERPTVPLAKTYANMTVGIQSVKEISGVNAVGRELTKILPGVERLGESPIGKAIKFGSFGIVGENRSPREMLEYYESGVDPIRKGRYWSIGSSTPIYGDKIKYYQPNWYRQVMADPLMTDVLYGSTREYWANSAMPNPRNPLGFLNPLTWDHWERKHYDDRPYPTSSSGLEAIPLVGPGLDITVGRLFKPFRRRPGLKKAHENYIQEINELYQYYASKEASAGHMYITPGGRMTPSSILEGDIIQPNAYFINEELSGSQAAGGVVGYSDSVTSAPTQDGVVRIVDPTKGFSPASTGSILTQREITKANMGYVSRANITSSESRSIQSLRDNMFVDSLYSAIDPNSLSFRLGETYYSATEVGGIYGFATTLLLGEGNPKRPVLESSSKMTSMNRMFWDMELGGAGGEISEIYRRFLPRHRRMQEYNPIRNKMPSWMPGQEYFTDFRHGDVYSKIEKGELRLPGAGYESLNTLHPDFFGEYGALDRFKILADVAPYSDQYRYYSSVVSRMHNAKMIDDEDYAQVSEIRKLVSKQKEKYDFHPYKFKYADVDKKEVTVLRWINKDTFLTKEYPGSPIKLAAISMPSDDDDSSLAQEARDRLHRVVKPGKKVKIGIDADALNRVRDDSMGTMEAVIYDFAGDPLNAELARISPLTSGFSNKKNPVKADWDDTSATGTRALYTDNAIKSGKRWEAFAHMDTAFHTKFLQVRSPLEMYKRKELYGKNWQTWSHPIRDWVKPTIEKQWERNPIEASARGAIVGMLMGTFTKSKKVGATIGALVGGIGSSVRTVKELAGRTVSDYTWIPKRRRKEREVDEYFDILKYVKYRGLYEKTRRLAVREEGMDPEELISYSSKKSRSTSYLRSNLEDAKKWLKINKSDPFADEEEIQSKLNAVNETLNFLDENRELVPTNSYAMQALRYKQMYESTLYGADSHGDLQNIYRALPKKDRPFFKEFMLASPKEREEILRLVPDNQKRFYQAKWGLKEDRQESLQEYFMTHTLPDATWKGWDPEYSMEEIKLKFIHNEGLEVEEFGYWKDDVPQVRYAPKTPKINSINPINVARLTKILKGMGLTDVDISMDIQILPEPTTNPYDISVNVMQDRSQDIVDSINSNTADLLL